MADSGKKPEVTESLIRQMTRLALEHNAVNLSQGFPNEGPPIEPVLGIASALIGGEMDNLDIFDVNISDVAPDAGNLTIRELLEKIYNPKKAMLKHKVVFEAVNIYFFVHNLAKEISVKADILYRGKKVVRTCYGY
jgi:hypothetical protein